MGEPWGVKGLQRECLILNTRRVFYDGEYVIIKWSQKVTPWHWWWDTHMCILMCCNAQTHRQRSWLSGVGTLIPVKLYPSFRLELSNRRTHHTIRMWDISQGALFSAGAESLALGNGFRRHGLHNPRSLDLVVESWSEILAWAEQWARCVGLYCVGCHSDNVQESVPFLRDVRDWVSDVIYLERLSKTAWKATRGRCGQGLCAVHSRWQAYGWTAFCYSAFLFTWNIHIKRFRKTLERWLSIKSTGDSSRGPSNHMVAHNLIPSSGWTLVYI